MPKRLPKTDFEATLRALTTAEVDFIVIGGVAAIVHGLGRTTYDVDVVYARSPANYQRIVRALSPFQPYLRSAPAGLPFALDERTLRAGLNFTLLTSIGGIDLLGEALGGGTYEDASRVKGFGAEFLAVDLDRLIDLKRAAGRPKDNEMIAELEALRQELGGSA